MSIEKPAPQPTDPVALVRAIAAMHDRASRRTRDATRRLVHEECALHLRALSDDPAALAELVEQGSGREPTVHDLA